MQIFLHTGMQWTSTNALQPSPEQNELTSVQCCSTKTGSQLALCHCVYTYAKLLFIHMCSESAQMHCSTAQGKIELPSVQCCSAKQAHSLHCVTVVTAMQTCSSYRCAVNQHRCTAALLRAKLSSPVFSAALQKRLAACTFSLWLHLCRFFFIQVCSEPAPMHCSTAQSKMSSPVFSAALQNRLTACTVSLWLHLCRFALHTCVQ